MRRARWLLLVLIAAIVAGLALTWQLQKSAQARTAPARPASLPPSVSARADDWNWEQTRDGKPVVRVWAKDFKQNAEGTRIDLEGVELHLFHQDGQSYDRVRSAKADFRLEEGLLYSDGAVEITMGMPAEGEPAQPGRLMVIRTSGAHFETKTGKAFTDRPAAFEFDRGFGSSVGATYDPGSKELLLNSAVKLTWRGTDPKAKPMEIEAGSLIYKEAQSQVYLMPWSKFHRDTLSMQGGNAVITLQEGVIRLVEAAEAKGVDQRPKQKTEYAANQLNLVFSEEGVLTSLTGAGRANLRSATPASRTDVSAERLDMEFAASGNDSILRKAVATTGAVIRSEPIARPGRPTPDTRVLRSESVALYMRENGSEMEKVETQAPGTAEFLPNRPGGKRRTVQGESIAAEYGAENQIKTFTATKAATRTENPPVKGKASPPALTWSDGMAAHFHPETGALRLLEQWDNFRYEEGERRARADRAEMHQDVEEIRLLGSARVWDPSGSTSGDTILMKQATGDYEAIGNVASTRQPEQKQKKDGLLTGDAPVQARAARMTSAADNSLITYTGDALLWQESDRIAADTIRIDRKSNRLEASGNVRTQLLDAAETAKKKAGPVFTVVKAAKLVYDDKARLAHYTGGTHLTRGGMTVDASEIRAWLTSGENASLDRAFADGKVTIVQVSPERTRTGKSEHSEYYVAEEKVLLSGGEPVFQDSVQGRTTGRQITYFAGSERLLVEGGEKKPVESRILRKRRTP